MKPSKRNVTPGVPSIRRKQRNAEPRKAAASATESDAAVSVVIVNYNGERLLSPCLTSVFSQSFRPMEVIVVDNGSTDGSVDLVQKNYPEVRLLRSPTNVGFAGGNNLGVATARGKYVALLNNDTVVDPSWLCTLVHAVESRGAPLVASKVFTEGVPDPFYRMNGTLNYLGYNIMGAFPDLSMIFYGSGASLLFDRERIGRPFLDEYFLYQEDVYLSWKLRLLGMNIEMVQDSIVHHKGSVTTRGHSSRMVTFYQERNRLLNALFFYEGRMLLLLLPYFVADLVSKFVVSILSPRKSFSGVLRAYAWIPGHCVWIAKERSRIQSSRTVPDRSIMKMMSYKVIEAESPIGNFVNALSRGYARLVGLSFHD